MAGLLHRVRSLPKHKIRRWLLAAVAIFLPMAMVASLLAAEEARKSEQLGFRQRLTDLAQTAADQIETQIAVFRTAATVLAESPELKPTGLAGALYRQAWEVGEACGGWALIAEATPGLPRIVNTVLAEPSLPDGSPPDLADGAQRAMATQRAAVGDLVVGRITHRPRIAISVPVFDGGQPRYVVSLIVLPDRFSAYLASLRLPEGAFAVLTDGAGRIVGRSADGASLVGHKADTWTTRVNRSEPADLVQTDLLGTEMLFAVHSIASVPAWHVAVAMPAYAAARLSAGPFRWVLLTRTALGVLLLLGSLLGWTVWRDTRDSYRRLDRVLAQAPAVIGVTRVWPDGQFERAFLSASSATVAGWPLEELLRMKSFTAIMAPDSVHDLRRHLGEALAGTPNTFEFPIRSSDGTPRRMRCSLARVDRFPDGSGTVASCIIDVTDLHLTEQRMRLLEKLAVLGEVSSGIAHELNQPLAAIALAAENGERALQRDPLNLATAHEKFARINEQAYRIGAVIDHVRAFSRDDAGKTDALDIAQVLHEVLLLLEARLSSHAITLEIDVPPHLPSVRGVAVLLEQAVLNVIGNACDAYRDGDRPSPRVIRIAACADTQWLSLSIADRAGGVPEALLGRIFDPFFTTKPVGQGTGLGLSISMASIVEMGGRMVVSNREGGACFEIVLPVGA